MKRAKGIQYFEVPSFNTCWLQLLDYDGKQEFKENGQRWYNAERCCTRCCSKMHQSSIIIFLLAEQTRLYQEAERQLEVGVKKVITKLAVKALVSEGMATNKEVAPKQESCSMNLQWTDGKYKGLNLQIQGAEDVSVEEAGLKVTIGEKKILEENKETDTMKRRHHGGIGSRSHHGANYIFIVIFHLYKAWCTCPKVG